MHRRFLNLRRNLYKNKKKISLTIFMVFCCIVVGKLGFSYFYTSGSFRGETEVNTLGFSPIVNNSTQRNQSVNLKTVMQIIRGLEMTTAESFNDPIFESEDLEID